MINGCHTYDSSINSKTVVINWQLLAQPYILRHCTASLTTDELRRICAHGFGSTLCDIIIRLRPTAQPYKHTVYNIHTTVCHAGQQWHGASVQACFAALRQIRSVRRSLTRTTLLTLVVTKPRTTVAQFSRAIPDNCYNGCSLSLTPPLVSCSQRWSRST